MSRKVANGIRRGLEEALAFAEGTAEEGRYGVHVPQVIDVRAIRTRLGMTQQEFAGRFGFSINTLRHWEQGKRVPEGPTRAYLVVIDRAPKAVQKALRAAVMRPRWPPSCPPLRRREEAARCAWSTRSRASRFLRLVPGLAEFTPGAQSASPRFAAQSSLRRLRKLVCVRSLHSPGYAPQLAVNQARAAR